MSDTETSRYPARVFWSGEDEGFIAEAPDLPGCSSFGATQQEALSELQDAIAAWIEAARAAGNPIPHPTRPSGADSYSGKSLVRMPKSLHAQIAKQARREGVSLNQHIVFLLTMATTQRAFDSIDLDKLFYISTIYNIEVISPKKPIMKTVNISQYISTYSQTMPAFIGEPSGLAVAHITQ